MNITACLAFYDEQPAMLVELVESLANAGVAGIVAVDGAYAEYPDAEPTTGLEQGQAIAEVSASHGMHCTLHVPRWPWAGNELEKRTFLFALAHTLVDIGEDWLWVIDGDEIVLSTGDLHRTLATTSRHVAEGRLVEPGGGEWPLRMLFRSQPTGITVGPYHARYESGDGRVLWASCQQREQDPAEALADCRILNRPLQRPAGRNLARRQYADRAVLLGLDQGMI